jgi:hypothetical protein
MRISAYLGDKCTLRVGGAQYDIMRASRFFPGSCTNTAPSGRERVFLSERVERA